MRHHVEIVAATERDPIRAAALLIFTKATRLQMDGTGLQGIIDHCHDDEAWMMNELDYMSKTIRSSWEFLDVTFSIRDVSRAMAQQMTRTRFTPIDGDLFGSYAMQSQRVTDMSQMEAHNPIAPENNYLHMEFKDAIAASMKAYSHLTEAGAKLEDARGVLPINLYCNLIAKYNLRMLCDLVQARSSYRAQGEFNVVAAEMRDALVEMWPWAELFLRPKHEIAKAAVDDLRVAIQSLAASSAREGLHDCMIKLAKVDDLLQGGK